MLTCSVTPMFILSTIDYNYCVSNAGTALKKYRHFFLCVFCFEALTSLLIHKQYLLVSAAIFQTALLS